MEIQKLWDVVVIGGGPSGMIAAGRAGELGGSVLLLEKNPTLGKKLLISGGGRCNITNNKSDIRTMLERFKGCDQFLFSPFSQFGLEQTIAFFRKYGLEMKEENEGRLFPTTDSSQTVLDALIKYMQQNNVSIQTNSIVDSLQYGNDKSLITIQLKSGEVLQTKKCIIATGGASRPETGSTGDGFRWLQELGHTIVPTNFSLVPIAIKDLWVKKLAGVALQDIKLTSYVDGKKHKAHKGKLLFTHVGISGPKVLNMSKEIGELLGYGDVHISLDLIPSRDHGNLKQVLNALLTMEHKKKLKNVLDKFIPSSLVQMILDLAKIDGDTPCHNVRSEDRTMIVNLTRGIPLHVKELLGADKAIVSSGGVALEEVNFKTMQSHKVPTIFIVGDTLNIDRPSGGYSLQLCWTTGYVAGTHAMQDKAEVG